MFGHTRINTLRNRIAHLVLLAMILLALLPFTTLRAQADGIVTTVFTKSIDLDTYGIYYQIGGLAPRLLTSRKVSSVTEGSVPVSLSPNGERVAVIPNHNTIFGNGLQVLALGEPGGGTPLQVSTDRVSSAVWSPDSTRLAFSVVRGDTTTVWIWQMGQALTEVHTFNATAAQLIGWSGNGNTLFLVHSNDTSDGPSYDRLNRINLVTGATTRLFTSAATGPIYSDFRLVQMPDGSQRISFITASTPAVCGATSKLQQSSLIGEILKTSGETTNAYNYAVWSGDTQVTYEKRVCMTDKTDGETGLTRVKNNSGLYIENLATNTKTQLTEGVFEQYKVTSFDGSTVRLSAPALGIYDLSASSSSSKTNATSIEPREDYDNLADTATPTAGGTVVVNNPGPYIHQLWDTPDSFNGNNACGPTSAVMALAGRSLQPWPITVNAPSPHTSNYGNYVPSVYTYNGYTFQAVWNDPSGRPARGAYGYIVGASGADWYWLNEYLKKHVGAGNVVQAAPSATINANWLRGQLNQGKVVIASTRLTAAGHLVLIKGYGTNAKGEEVFIVHDPYGRNATGAYDGRNVRYTWNKMELKQFWAVPR